MKKLTAVLISILMLASFAACMVNPSAGPGSSGENTGGKKSDDDFIKIYDENGSPVLPTPKAIGNAEAVSYYDFLDPQKRELLDGYAYTDLAPYDEAKVTAVTDGTVIEVPVLTDYLRYTGYSAFLLSGNDGKLIGVQIEKDGFDAALVTKETIRISSEIVLPGGKTVNVRTGTAASRCRVFAEWAESGGDSFYPLAARVPADGSGALEIIGKIGENGRLVVAEKDRADVSGIELEYVPAVYSLSEAGEAYKLFVENRLRFAKEELFLIPWEGDLIAGKSAYGKLISDALDSSADGDCIHRLHPDEVIAIPMANCNSVTKSGWEGDRMLFISFKNGEAIGETVLEFYHPWATVGLADPVYYNGVYAAKIYERLGGTGDGGYKALDHIEYVSFVKSLGDLNGIAGIYADAGGYHAIMK